MIGFLKNRNMGDTPEDYSAEENRNTVEFMAELLVVLKRHGLTHEEGDSEVPHERAASVMVSEVHDWYRSGQLDVEAESFADFCERVQEVNYEVDDFEGEFSSSDT